MKYKLLTPASLYALTLTEVKSHCRIDHTDDDSYLTRLIEVVTDVVEEFTGRQLLPATWLAYADSFDELVKLRPSPVSAVSFVKYYNSDNELTTLEVDTDYYTDLVITPEQVVPKDGWPSTYNRPNAVQIQFTAGYADAASVPPAIKQAMLILCHHYYDRREEIITGVSLSEIPKQSGWLLRPYRIKTY